MAHVMPLSPDEAYYWLWSKQLSYSYYDHPPMVALWIKLGCWLGGHSSLGVRLLGPIAAFFGSILLYFSAKDFNPSYSGRISAANNSVLIFNATLAINAGSVTMTPDTPLLFFTCFSLWSCGRLLVTKRPFYYGLIGLGFGLSLVSKYTAILFILAFCLWCLVDKEGRIQLKKIPLWGAGAFTCLLFSPVVWWNAHHQWVSFAKQGGRTGEWNPHRAFQFLAELIAGQFGLATPLLFIGFVVGAVKLGQYVFKTRDSKAVLLFLLAMVPLVIFIQHALGDRVQANWLGILYPPFALIAALYGQYKIRSGVALGLIISAFVYAQASWGVFPLPAKFDVTLRQLGGWQEFAEQLNNRVPTSDVLMVEEYGLASELRFYLPQRTIVAIDHRWRYFEYPKSVIHRGYLIRSQKRKDSPTPQRFSSFAPLNTLQRKRKDQVAGTYSLYKVMLQNDKQTQTETVRLP